MPLNNNKGIISNNCIKYLREIEYFFMYLSTLRARTHINQIYIFQTPQLPSIIHKQMDASFQHYFHNAPIIASDKHIAPNVLFFSNIFSNTKFTKKKFIKQKLQQIL